MTMHGHEAQGSYQLSFCLKDGVLMSGQCMKHHDMCEIGFVGFDLFVVVSAVTWSVQNGNQCPCNFGMENGCWRAQMIHSCQQSQKALFMLRVPSDHCQVHDQGCNVHRQCLFRPAECLSWGGRAHVDEEDHI